MELVKQERCGECGPACLATVLGFSLKVVVGAFPDCHEKGVGTTEIMKFLSNQGVPCIESLTWPSPTIPAILTVPSLNYPGLLHYIVWDGRRYLDPSNEKLQYPADAPTINGSHIGVSWACVILLWSSKQ